MTDDQPLNANLPPASDDMDPQVVERGQSTSDHNDIPCEDRALDGHTQWNCSKCRERLDDSCDSVLRDVMLSTQGWTQRQLDALGSLRQFDKTPWIDLMPDPSLSRTAQLRAWGSNNIKELQARMDAARELHEIMTAQHHLQNMGKANLTTSPANNVVCKDDDGNECHPQWTCHHCLARLDEHLDNIVREEMSDSGWTEAQINSIGPLRQFDTKPWSEMTPDSSEPQLAQVRAWGSTRLRELTAREKNARDFHKARFGSNAMADEAERQ